MSVSSRIQKYPPPPNASLYVEEGGDTQHTLAFGKTVLVQNWPPNHQNFVEMTHTTVPYQYMLGHLLLCSSSQMCHWNHRLVYCLGGRQMRSLSAAILYH